MDVRIKIDHVVKAYGDNVIIPDLSVEIEKGEFFTLLGPSGCGKTTLLRMIAGFNTIEGGEFYFNDQMINNLDPEERNIGMVFQNYAIFPHLTVKKNVSFGLENRKLPKDVIEATTQKFLKLMQIDEYKDRLPDRLSGGQQQRVALARALAIEPNVLLMDEPLSNLDAKLRLEMREVIKEIQNKLRITTVYVTHDQEEAMAVSDRIAVMNHGIIQQIGSSRELYLRPQNLFVATFIGRTNILDLKISRRADSVGLLFAGGYYQPMPNLVPGVTEGQMVAGSIRPEEFVIVPSEAGGIEAVIDYCTFLGQSTHYFVQLRSGERVEIIQESRMNDPLGPGSPICLQVKAEKINVFSADGSATLLQ